MDGTEVSNPSPSEESGLHARLLAREPLSEALWGLRFADLLPHPLSRDGVRAVAGNLDRVGLFLRQGFPGLAQESCGVVPSNTIAEAKRRYLRHACDCIELQHAGRTVGIFVGEPEDWATYYCRSFAILPAYRRPAVIRRFVKEVLFQPMEALGIERFVAETSPVNLAMSRLFLELRFHVTGHRLTDRWGPLVRYTKFLDPECNRTFSERFGNALKPGEAVSGEEDSPTNTTKEEEAP